MRRENSIFNAAFVSYEGSRLFNNDYFGHAELNRFACYVAADGLESGDIESGSAKAAVDAAITAFHERPSIKKSALRRYVRAAHRALRDNSGRRSMRASLMIAITDYQKIRYAWAGNTRFYLYHAGRLTEESRDHSLSMQMVRRGDLPIDKVAKHEQRTNLARFVGQPEILAPQVSKKIKVHDGDIFALLTRGVWEHCDSSDIRAALDSSENDPKMAIEGIERLLLDPCPNDIDNYTVAVVFIDRVYKDPNKGKRLKKILLITIPIVVVLAAVIIILLIINNSNKEKHKKMDTAFNSAVGYVLSDNYVRAVEEFDSSIKLADELHEYAFRENADKWRRMAEAVQKADSLFSSKDYTEAQNAYQTALGLVRYTDNSGKTYIERRIASTERFITIRDTIAIGDVLIALDNLSEAESKYLDAWRLASQISDIEGRDLAIAALQNVYNLRDREETKQAEKDAEKNTNSEQQAQSLQEAVNMEAAGDKAAAERDYISAGLFYAIALERFTAQNDLFAIQRIGTKQKLVSETVSQNEEQIEIAKSLVYEGDYLFDDGGYEEARLKYIQARNMYSQLNDIFSLDTVIQKIDLCDTRIARLEEAAEPSIGESTANDANVGNDNSEAADNSKTNSTEQIADNQINNSITPSDEDYTDSSTANTADDTSDDSTDSDLGDTKDTIEGNTLDDANEVNADFDSADNSEVDISIKNVTNNEDCEILEDDVIDESFSDGALG